MKIKHLKMENFRGIKSLELDFTNPKSGDPESKVLVGINGSGKTSILVCASYLLSNLFEHFLLKNVNPKFKDKLINLGEANYDPLNINIDADESQYKFY